MTVINNSIQETQDRVSDLEVQPKSKDLSSAMEFEDRDSRKKGVKESVEAEMASESGGSSEEYVGDSPRSVGKWRMNKLGVVHSQVLKIREEDSHLGEDIIVSAKDNVMNNAGSGQNAQIRFVSSAVDVMLSSRLILPSSPLSGKTAVKASP